MRSTIDAAVDILQKYKRHVVMMTMQFKFSRVITKSKESLLHSLVVSRTLQKMCVLPMNVQIGSTLLFSLSKFSFSNQLSGVGVSIYQFFLPVNNNIELEQENKSIDKGMIY